MSSLLWDNFCAYSLQIALLVGVAALLPSLFRLRAPNARLAYWYALLAACALLPLVRAWQPQAISGNVQVVTVVSHVTAAMPVARPIPWRELALAAIALGAAVRLAWLLAGFQRLRRYRRAATPLEHGCGWSTEAELLVSADVAGPVTFGWRKPVILLPARFPDLAEDMQDAILCHEILHVRRRDWLFVIAEELVRAAFWFHPAIWWVLAEIQLAREQAVDREVLDMTRSRDPYIDALLAMAGARPELDLAPAPLFLRKRHLKQRVMGILKEAKMSKSLTAGLLAAGLATMAAVCWFVSGAIPLAAAPQSVFDGPGVTVDTGGADLLHRGGIVYPADAQAKGIEGTVVVRVTVDSNGEVSDASVLSGPDELRRTVQQSVLSWHFTSASANSKRQVSVTFGPPMAHNEPVTEPRPATGSVIRSGVFAASIPAPPSTASPSPGSHVIESIQISGLSEEAKAELLASLPVKVGDDFVGLAPKIFQAVHEFDKHLTVTLLPTQSGNAQLMISVPMAATGMESAAGTASKIRVGGNVQATNLISQSRPLYPPAAKEARIQGVVQLEATIGPDGHIQDLKVISGHPLLVQAALEAVKDWVYRPTLLNGNPVTVVTMIDVNFTLSQ
ncbi:MAG: M56 family metallopeptidase [Bryobacteraceae bacterium]|jgi:TonB family protein